jgi:hypothetical protein
MAERPRRPKKPRRDHDQSSEPSPDYEIGYGKPPLHSRFKAGKSANPKGRPKRHQNLRTVIEEALDKLIEIREGDRTRSLTKREAMVLTMLNKSLKGDAKAQTTWITLLRSVGLTAELPEPTNSEPVTAHDEDIIAEFLSRQQASTENAAAPQRAIDNQKNIPTDEGRKP